MAIQIAQYYMAQGTLKCEKLYYLTDCPVLVWNETQVVIIHLRCAYINAAEIYSREAVTR